MHNVLNCSGPSGGSWEALVDVWEMSWGQPGHILGRLGATGDVWGRSWGQPGRDLGCLGTSWEGLAGSLDAFRGILGAPRGKAREKMMTHDDPKC